MLGFLKGGPDAAASGEKVWQDRVFSTEYACANCKISYEELQPRTFSFNSPYGACPVCEGLGSRLAFDADLVIPDRSLSLSAGAIAPWKPSANAFKPDKRQQAVPQ